MGAPQYQTGFFSTPDDLLTAANQVNDQVNAINNAIDGNASIPQDWWDGFDRFRSGWLRFFSSTFAGHGFQTGNSGSVYSTTGSWLTSDVAAQLRSYEEQTATWAKQAQAFGAPIAGAIIEPAEDPTLPDPTKVFAGVSITLVLLIVLLLVWKS